MKSSYRVVWSCLCGWALSHTNNMTEANRSPPRDQCSPNKEYLSGLVLFNIIVCVCFFVWECKSCVMFILGPFPVWGKISFQEDDDIAGFIICIWFIVFKSDYTWLPWKHCKHFHTLFHFCSAMYQELVS